MTDKMQKGKDAENMAAEFLKTLGTKLCNATTATKHPRLI